MGLRVIIDMTFISLWQTMENEHSHEIGMIQQDIGKLRSGHERTLQSLEADFNIKLISEYHRYQVWKCYVTYGIVLSLLNYNILTSNFIES